METKIQRFSSNGTPEGYAKLEGEELSKWINAALMQKLAAANVLGSEARIREHQNGLDAATLQLAADRKVQEQAGDAVIQLQMEMGVEKADDLVIKNGVYYRKVNGKAQEAAQGTTPPEAPKV